jgi:hypothetical protein
VVEFNYLGATAAWFFTVDNLIDDDFGFYAHDGIPDLYQVFLFGENDPRGNGFVDWDHDRVDNLAEFATGGFLKFPDLLRPAPFTIITDHPESPEHNVIRFRRRADGDGSLPLLYEVWAGDDLVGWERLDDLLHESEPGEDGFLEVEIRDRVRRADRERRFYRLGFVPKDRG